MKNSENLKRSLCGFTALVLLALVYAFVTWLFGTPSENEDKFEAPCASVHFVDVGQGDCAVIMTPYGNILIDAGIYEVVDDTAKYISSLGIKEFEYAVFTHPHSDHIGGASELLKRFDVKNVIMPNATSNSYPFEKLIERLEKEKCGVIAGEAGKSFELGENAKIELLAPLKDYTLLEDELNNTSVVLKFTFGEVSFLLTGDAEISSELDMLENNKSALDCDILKVAHHGSSTSSCHEFLKAASPDIAIISAGKNNDYGHPHREVVRDLENLGIDKYITYERGSVTVTTDGSKYSISCEK